MITSAAGSNQSFVHLHVHSHFSLLDGATRIKELVERVKFFNQPAVAITDHGNMFGVIELYSAAIKAGVKPIIGCELYLTPTSRHDRTPGGGNKESYHLLVLAMNRVGYQNLMRLSTLGFTEGFYRKPRIDKEILQEFNEGLICTSTCIGGEVPQAFLNKDRAAAEEMAKTYLSIFGPDRFFMELQDHGMDEQKTLNPELIEMAKRLGVATIATNDVHYLDKGDVEAHDILCCINTGANVEDENRFKFPSGEFYLKGTDEMAALFPQHPEALANTLRVADMCELELDLSSRHAPVYKVPQEITDTKGKHLTDAQYLRQLVYAGVEERLAVDDLSDELRRRIDYELEVICSKGFASYFLIVWDVVNYCRENDIPVGARGSGCSAMVTFGLYISTPDPIRYGLYFERFMDPDRDEMPDIDLDICQNGRQQVIEYVRNKYGHVAQIITFGTMKAKAAIKDVARVMGLGFNEANELTKLVPSDLKMTIDKALDQEPELRKRYQNDEQIKKIIDVARKLEGSARNAGVHAAGVVVADKDLTNFLPLYRASDADALVTQFDGPTVERVGLLKMDFLGLRTLTTLERARRLAIHSVGHDINIERLDLADPKVYEVFQRGDTKGIFQFESGGMRDVILRMKPNRIEDLIAANALYRPGPMEYIPDYVARKHGQAWDTAHPIMTEVLEETYGIMVYQEQVSRMVNRLGGIELKKAFRLAKAISKKKTAMIEEMREPFLQGCESNGVARSQAQKVFEDILKFGGYAFNKAHSTGYAIVAYQTAWMKCYFPVEFMTALMTFEAGNTEKVAEYCDACKHMGISVEPPEINTSHYDFGVDRSMRVDLPAGYLEALQAPPGANRLATAQRDGKLNGQAGGDGVIKEGDSKDHPAIRFGLGAIKGVGERAVAAIVAEREANGPFQDLFGFCSRVDLSAVNRSTMEALICAGAFDCTGGMRRAMFEAVESAVRSGQQAQQDKKAGQMNLFGGYGYGDYGDVYGNSGSGSGSGDYGDVYGNSGSGSGSGDYGDGGGDDGGSGPTLPQSEWPEADMLAREKNVMGMYITKHPLASHDSMLTSCATARTVDLENYSDGDEVVLGGMVTNFRTVTARGGRNPGKALGIITIEDLHGRVEAILFNKDLQVYRPLIEPDAILFLQGEVDKKREQPCLRVSRVVPRDQAKQAFAHALLLDVTADTPVDGLVRTLRTNRGECPVYLNVPTGEGYIGQVMCSPSLRVSCTAPFLEEVRRLAGLLRITILGPKHEPMSLEELQEN